LVESELYESKIVFKELIENISSGVAIYETVDNGETFIIREMNKAGLRICETTREEIAAWTETIMAAIAALSE